jgi:hypothetical protein
MPYKAGKSLSFGNRQRGYALVLALVLLISGGLYAILHQLNAAGLATEQTASTANALQKARDALLGYAVTYRESHEGEGFGYLPCPDITGDGIAEGSCDDANELIGLLPYRTLGLSDLRDASGTCLWYAVSSRFRNNPKSDPLNWDSQGDITINDATGSKALQTPNDSEGGVAAVVFAAGAPLGNQSTGRTQPNFPCAIDPSLPGKYLEYVATPFRQGPGSDVDGTTLLNDQLRWLTSADVAARIRSRNDFPTYLNAGLKGIQSALSFSLPTPGTGNSLPAIPPASLSQSDLRFYLQWKDQFRYFKCSTAKSYCYQLGSSRCDGLLLFGGLSGLGKPRPATARALEDHFESEVLELARNTTQTLAADKTFALYAGKPDRDLALCLSPQSQMANMPTDTSDTSPVAVSSEVTTSSPSAILPASSPAARVVTDGGPAYLQLGEIGASDSAYGCLWYPEPFQLGASSEPVYLRAYFAFTIDTMGHGFTFTLADADSSVNPSSSICGKGGASLGYAGANGFTAPINYPKLALEIDTHKDSDFADADNSHLAFLYWGRRCAANDDNAHGAGNLPCNPDKPNDPNDLHNPVNPANGNSGYQAYSITTSKTYHVRMEMQRNYVAASNPANDRVDHVLRVYISDSLSTCSKFEDLSADLTSFTTYPPQTPDCQLTPTISTSISFHRKLACPTSNDITCSNPTTDDPVPMKQIWLGFTSGQDAITQLIRIQRFKTQISQ